MSSPSFSTPSPAGPSLGCSAAAGELLPALVTAPPGPCSRELAARLSAVECPAFDARRKAREQASGEGQGPILYAEGRGSNVWDVDGNRYVDFVAGFGALPFGHGDPSVLAAAEAQQRRLGLALGDVYSADVKVALLERLAALLPSPGARVLLGSSGADAVTAALKTCVLATGRPGVLAFEGAYHGLSHGPLAACGLHPSFREPFAGQLGGPVVFAPYPASVAALDASLSACRSALARGDIGCVLVEPLLGRGGCIEPPPAFLAELHALARESGALLVADEIWTGLGRTGAMLASVEAGVVPDLVCIGKALGGGLPLSACIGTSAAMEAWGRHGGTVLHTATHFGAPPACAAALAVMQKLEAEHVPARARAAGIRLRAALERQAGTSGARPLDGRGLMVGVAFDGVAGGALAVARRLLHEGWLVLTGGPRGEILTLTPALTVNDELVDAFAAAVGHVLQRA